MRYTIEDVRSNLKSVVKTEKEEKIPVAKLIDLNHTIMWWAVATGLMKHFHADSFNLLDAFWVICEKEFDINLKEEEKRWLFKKFIED